MLKMRTRHKLFALATALSLMTAIAGGCTNGESIRHLDLAESCMNSDPELALRTIDSIDTRFLLSRSRKARYALLKTMALDKNFIDTTDVNVILPAAEYYARHGSPDKKLESFMYLGRVYFNASQYDDAMTSFLIAAECVDEVDDHKLIGLLYSSISEVYFADYNFVKATEYSECAIENFSSAGDSVNVWYALGRLASLYSESLEGNKADRLYQYFLSRPIVDSAYYNSVALDYACELVLADNSRPKLAVELYERSEKDFGTVLNNHDNCAYAYALAMAGRPKESEIVFQRIDFSDVDSSALDVWRYRLEKARGNYRTALHFFEKASDSQQRIVLETLARSINEVQIKYYQSRLQSMAVSERLSDIHKLLMLCLIVMIILASVALYFYKKKIVSDQILYLTNLKTAAEAQLALLKESSSSDRERLDEATRKFYELKRKYVELHRTRLNEITDLCTLYLSPSQTNRKNILFSNVKKQLEFLNNDKDGQAKFEKMIDESFDGVMSKFRVDFNFWNESDLRFISYVMAGFESKVIANMLMISPNSVYVKKNRLKKKISESGSPNTDLYLKVINSRYHHNESGIANESV